MDEGGLEQALSRAERALEKIERGLAQRVTDNGRDEALRTRVREAVAELDQLIRDAAH